MHTGNARRIFCDNVTCFGTNTICSNRSHLPNCFIKALHFLLARLHCFFRENAFFQGNAFLYFFSGGDIRNTAYCHDRNNSHFALESSKLLLLLAKVQFSLIHLAAFLYLFPADCFQEIHKRIFCDNVACFGTNTICLNRSHLPNCFIKALHFVLAWLLCFFRENTSFFYFFLGGDIRNTPDCPGSNKSYFDLENEG